ncbi:hypothetical protein [Mameliella sp.]|uniref:hypothetical protein n=1 Tax=Mameliella sp. TaxID=1924940 RepID=UPI003BAD6E0D
MPPCSMGGKWLSDDSLGLIPPEPAESKLPFRQVFSDPRRARDRRLFRALFISI